jgi:protein involved in polysaccharide export with SLBB domain
LCYISRTPMPVGRILRLFLRIAAMCIVCQNAGFAQSREKAAQPAYLALDSAAVGRKPENRRNEELQSASAVRPFAKGDAVRIAVFQDTLHFVNGVYHIGDDGCVFLPILGTVKIDTMSERNLSLYLNSAYLQFLRYPTVQVQPLIRISLLGGFAKPGLFYISPSASLWDALALAGGPAREDGMKKLTWERNGKTVSNNLLASIQSGASLQTLGMQSGDQLWVTHVAKRDGWEIFTTDVLPIISVSASVFATTATLYYVSQTLRGTK